MQTQLMRSNNDKVIGGVCGGLAHYFGVDPVLVRLGFVLMTFATGIGVLLYPVLWLVMPVDGQPGILNHAFHNAQQVSQQVGQSVSTAFQGQTQRQPRFDPQTGQPLAQPVAGRNRALGTVLLALGGLMLASFVHLSGPFFALAIIGAGVYLLRKS